MDASSLPPRRRLLLDVLDHREPDARLGADERLLGLVVVQAHRADARHVQQDRLGRRRRRALARRGVAFLDRRVAGLFDRLVAARLERRKAAERAAPRVGVVGPALAADRLRCFLFFLVVVVVF